MRKRRIVAAVAAGLIIPALLAAEDWELPLDEPQLKPAPGYELTATQCQVCHSADYMITQPRLNRDAWTAIVVKMREKYGALVDTNQTSQIVDYLTTVYGKN